MDPRVLQQPCRARGVKADLIAVLDDEPLRPQRHRPVDDVVRRLRSCSLVRWGPCRRSRPPLIAPTVRECAVSNAAWLCMNARMEMNSRLSGSPG